MSLVEVKIPDVGDAEEVEVIEICVSAGDKILSGAVLIVIESEKASMELPTELAGKVMGISLTVGDIVNEGDVVATLETEASDAQLDEAENKIGPVGEGDGSPAVRDSFKSEQSEAGNRDDQRIERETEVEVRVPDVGDAEEIVVIEVAVETGDAVSVDDVLVVIESEKASMEIPSPVAGT
ncbi:MAG: biotin/lipoyl-containing protein, partial [Pseudomonadota bacterium]|nr:biotin/lipoyl-containing protein [Pseudomonadota bacterium]